MSKHTPGPWAVDAVFGEALHEIVLDYDVPKQGSPIVIANMHGDRDDKFLSSVVAEHNARRICACVNACEGIANPEGFKELIEAARNLADKSDKVGECDHKRASCEEVGCIGHEIAVVRKLIAKLETKS